jgi:hypothetical protein
VIAQLLEQHAGKRFEIFLGNMAEASAGGLLQPEHGGGDQFLAHHLGHGQHHLVGALRAVDAAATQRLRACGTSRADAGAIPDRDIPARHAT